MRKRKENESKICKTLSVQISPYSLEQEILRDISRFTPVPEGYSSSDVSVSFEADVEWDKTVNAFFEVTFRRLETDEEHAERLEKTKKEEEKNRVSHEKRRKTAEANKEKKEKELFEKLKEKYGAADSATS